MTTSSTYLFDPNLADIVDEAFERVGIDPASITQRHINSARRSMNLMLSYWATRGVTDWGTDRASIQLTEGQRTFDLPKGAYDILSAVLRRDNIDTPMTAISRTEYLELPTKDDRGRPDRYFVDREPHKPVAYIWQVPNNSTDTIEVWYFRQFRDVGGATDALDMPHFFFEAFAAGLAAKLAEKYQPEMVSMKVQLANDALNRALAEDGSRANFKMKPRY